ncbi:RNA polymerase sigma-70 factor (ECF subfamily) [Amycolatopsis lexingtonensis]|uniref:RNA polymerase sigma-70 factor (ECF subfamily) n=1 Tax=Amycolatopsis lexingtonensis TaxID=218822 RepID=A0ABR9HU20_9PSEU|nr:sigma-70 family RNA polymerase sigma factor [Amycolatopsis lexingtonensis]MBE1494410.1 RNA polymerase sigma-70 factor (ECF subfamily) [Amycolatopsis lexingtonensis]
MSPHSAEGASAPSATFTLDPALVRSAIRGDHAAVAGLLHVLRPPVFRYCLGRLRTWQDGSSDAEDCAQDVLLAIVNALPGYRYEADGFLAFVFGIASHKVSDFHRRRARDRTSPVAEPPADRWTGGDPTGEEVERAAALDWSSGLLDTLPPRQREILVLRIILGLTAEETAAAVGLASAGAVRVAQHRALATLRRSLVGRKRAAS